MTKEDWIRDEQIREDLIDKAYQIALTKMLDDSGAYFDKGYIQEEGVSIGIEISRCSCCQPDSDTILVRWEELGYD